MKNFKTLFTIFVTLVVLSATAFILIDYLKPGPGGISVNSNPESSVYIDGVSVGKTPFTITNKAGQINLKLVPNDSASNLLPYETKINVVSGVQTVIHREFGPTEDLSSGDVVSYEKISGANAGVIIVTDPDNAQVWIDGVAQGFSPYTYSSITTGSHKVSVKDVGYLDRTLNVKTRDGYRLMIFVKLAKADQSTQALLPSPTPVESIKTYVLIKNTSTGFLRMRTEPGLKGEEIAELKPGTKYLYLERDTQSGWNKIQYQDPAPGLPNGITGWVSGQYSQIVNATVSGTFATASPSLTPSPSPVP